MKRVSSQSVHMTDNMINLLSSILSLSLSFFSVGRLIRKERFIFPIMNYYISIFLSDKLIQINRKNL